jgi:hypothetical protein
MFCLYYFKNKNSSNKIGTAGAKYIGTGLKSLIYLNSLEINLE